MLDLSWKWWLLLGAAPPPELPAQPADDAMLMRRCFREAYRMPAAPPVLPTSKPPPPSLSDRGRKAGWIAGWGQVQIFGTLWSVSQGSRTWRVSQGRHRISPTETGSLHQQLAALSCYSSRRSNPQSKRADQHKTQLLIAHLQLRQGSTQPLLAPLVRCAE
jgi:hypothetical protein